MCSKGSVAGRSHLAMNRNMPEIIMVNAFYLVMDVLMIEVQAA